MDMGWKVLPFLIAPTFRFCRNPLPYGYGLEGYSSDLYDMDRIVVILCRMDMGWKAFRVKIQVQTPLRRNPLPYGYGLEAHSISPQPKKDWS